MDQLGNIRDNFVLRSRVCCPQNYCDKFCIVHKISYLLIFLAISVYKIVVKI